MDVQLSTETIYQIWNDGTGDRLEIGSDGEGLDLIEIRQITSDGKTEARFAFPFEYLGALINALTNRHATGK